MSRSEGFHSQDIVIASSGTVSSAIDFRGYKLFALKLGTITGATFAVHASPTEDGTYVAVVDDAGAAITITATDDKIVGIDTVAGSLAALPFVKLVSAGAEAAERTITVFLTV